MSPVNTPRYSGCSPLLKRLINGAQNDKIGSNCTSENTKKIIDNQFVKSDFRNVCAVGENHTPTTPSQKATTPPPKDQVKPRRSKTLQTSVERMGDLASKSWRSLWQHQKVARAFEVTSRQAGSIAFTANLSPDREIFLMSRNNPADDLRRRMANELRKTFGQAVPVAFVFEISPRGKLHVHGTAILPTNTETSRKRFREAIARACGRITGKGAPRQVDVDDLTDGIGWAAYTQKEYDTACRYLGTNKIGFIANEIVRLAKG